MTILADLPALVALASLAHLAFAETRRRVRERRKTVAVSKAVQAVIDTIPARIQAALDAQKAELATQAATAQAQAVTDALAQYGTEAAQDDDDTVTALEAALPPAPAQAPVAEDGGGAGNGAS